MAGGERDEPDRAVGSAPASRISISFHSLSILPSRAARPLHSELVER
jgi:hypothetical protein